MRVLITRPEREATALAAALGERGHSSVVAPLFRLDMLPAPAGFAAALEECQAVLLTSANGARALAEATELRGKPILAVGDATSTTADSLGFISVTSASGDSATLVDLVVQRLDPKAGPLVHVSGADFTGGLAPRGFEVRHFALYDAHAVEKLPEAAKVALEACTIDTATFFSPRAASLFVQLVEEAGLTNGCRPVAAVAISPAALAPLVALPFRAAIAAETPTRLAVMEEIDRLAAVPTPGAEAAGETAGTAAPAPLVAVDPPHEVGLLGVFLAGVAAALVVLAAALLTLPYWPEDLRTAWRGAAPPPLPQPPDVAGPVETAKKELEARIEDLEKRVRALTAAVQADKPPDPAIADLKSRLAAAEAKIAAPPRPATPTAPPPPPPASTVALEKDVAALKQDLTGFKQEIAPLKPDVGAMRQEFAGLRTSMTNLEQLVEGQREALAKAQSEASKRSAAEQETALRAARASIAIGVAARLSAAIAGGQPFVSDLALLEPFARDDAKLAQAIAALQPQAATGVTSHAVLLADFPAVAKAALADDLSDDSFGQRVLAKLRSIVSLRRVGADVEGESTEAKLARAEAALEAGDLAAAVELVKTLPAQTRAATAAWQTRAETHLAARRTVDRMAAHAVTLLGAAR